MPAWGPAAAPAGSERAGTEDGSPWIFGKWNVNSEARIGDGPRMHPNTSARANPNRPACAEARRTTSHGNAAPKRPAFVTGSTAAKAARTGRCVIRDRTTCAHTSTPQALLNAPSAASMRASSTRSPASIFNLTTMWVSEGWQMCVMPTGMMGGRPRAGEVRITRSVTCVGHACMLKMNEQLCA